MLLIKSKIEDTTGIGIRLSTDADNIQGRKMGNYSLQGFGIWKYLCMIVRGI